MHTARHTHLCVSGSVQMNHLISAAMQCAVSPHARVDDADSHCACVPGLRSTKADVCVKFFWNSWVKVYLPRAYMYIETHVSGSIWHVASGKTWCIRSELIVDTHMLSVS
jgi:hypothetical protein